MNFLSRQNQSTQRMTVPLSLHLHRWSRRYANITNCNLCLTINGSQKSSRLTLQKMIDSTSNQKIAKTLNTTKHDLFVAVSFHIAEEQVCQTQGYSY